MDAAGDFPAAELLPAEAVALGAAVEGRRREFALGRSLARKALAELGYAAEPILRGAHREPQWPSGIVGSITHCAQYCAAAVAPATVLLAVGIDAERHRAIPDGVVRKIARDEELQWMRQRTDESIRWDCVTFSAKESVFKAWFSLAHRWLGFDDVSLTFDPPAGTFVAHLTIEPLVAEGRVIADFRGRFLVSDERVLTSVTVDA